MRSLEGKNVYITGGSSGIGLETAKLVYAQGANLVIIARDKDKLHLAVREIEAVKINQIQRIATASLDVSDIDVVRQQLPNIVEDYGTPDFLVANAGILVVDYFENTSYEVFDRIMKINVYGVYNIITTILPKMKLKGGRIVIISSIAGLTGVFGYAAYSASKFALVGLADSLRYELKAFNISVALVCPPEVETPMTDEEVQNFPPESRAVKNFSGRLTAGTVAKSVLKSITSNRFFIMPGLKAKMTYGLVRYLPGFVVRGVTDLIIASSRSQQNRQRR